MEIMHALLRQGEYYFIAEKSDGTKKFENSICNLHWNLAWISETKEY